MVKHWSKAEARSWGRRARSEMTVAERLRCDELILSYCQRELAGAKIDCVHVFLPIMRTHEVNTWRLVEWIWETWPKLRVYVPRMRDNAMEQVRVTPQSEFSNNEHGIPEPVTGDVMPADEPMDFVLTPLLAVDAHGNRVGYGSGFYDRFLTGQPRTYKVGLAYRACLVPGEIVHEAYDVPLNAVVTERGLFPLAG